jgi:hypothetical protein
MVWPFESLPTPTRFLKMKKSGTSGGIAEPIKQRSRHEPVAGT